ncbi:MAG: hypothetical protein ABSB31_05975 [Dehalococcoidia bacterium]
MVIQRSPVIVTGNIFDSSYENGSPSIALNQQKKLIRNYGITKGKTPISISVESYGGVHLNADLNIYDTSTCYIACPGRNHGSSSQKKFHSWLDTYGTGTPVLVVLTESTAFVLKGLRDLSRII